MTIKENEWQREEERKMQGEVLREMCGEEEAILYWQLILGDDVINCINEAYVDDDHRPYQVEIIIIIFGRQINPSH